MTPKGIGAALVAAGLLAMGHAQAEPAQSAEPSLDVQSAEAFVKVLYRPGGHDIQRWPRLFDADMRKLMEEDRRLTPAGDEGALDSDPFCACQDDTGMKVQFRVLGATATAATAEANLVYPDGKDRVVFRLVREHGLWRIHDMASKDMPSLRKVFIDSNAFLAKHH
jgi:hypothetical protein